MRCHTRLKEHIWLIVCVLLSLKSNHDES